MNPASLWIGFLGGGVHQVTCVNLDSNSNGSFKSNFASDVFLGPDQDDPRLVGPSVVLSDLWEPLVLDIVQRDVAGGAVAHEVDVGAWVRELAQLLEGLLTCSIPHLDLQGAVLVGFPREHEVVEGGRLIFRLLLFPIDRLVGEAVQQTGLADSSIAYD